MIEQQIKQEIEYERNIKRLRNSSERRSKRLIKEWIMEVKNIKTNSDITEEMIEIARNYPIENLIEFKKGKANCIWHKDKNPSMTLKNNKVRCWSCGEKGDSISVYMKLHGVDFKTAVKNLQ